MMRRKMVKRSVAQRKETLSKVGGGMQLFFLAAATLSIIKLPSGSSVSLLVESVELPVFEDFFMAFLGKNLVVTELKLTTGKKVKSS